MGPNIDPWGTSEFTLANSERPASHAIACSRDDKYDWNYPRDKGLNLYNESLLISMEWYTRSNALRKSSKKCSNNIPFITAFKPLVYEFN